MRSAEFLTETDRMLLKLMESMLYAQLIQWVFEINFLYLLYSAWKFFRSSGRLHQAGIQSNSLGSS